MSAVPMPSIFESFNARVLEPEQVARTFVPSELFGRLAMRRHTIVIGPRGSGKTTLLKMLQQRALEAWKHPVADAYRESIDFTGVFIPTDNSWREQLDALGDRKLDDVAHEVLVRSAFTTHVLRAVLLAVMQRGKEKVDAGSVPFRRVKLSSNAEADLVGSITESWRIKPVALSLLALKHALSDRLSDILAIANRELQLGETGRSQRLAETSYLHIDFLQATSAMLERFEDFAECPPGKWALLCDELEIAPDWIRRKLVQSVRSTDSRILFKLALSPYSHDLERLESPLAGAPMDDYDEVILWYPEKRDGYRFCSDLWRGMLSERNLPPWDPEETLGRSVFDTPAGEWKVTGTAYGPGSRLSRQFARLARSDESFRDYLRSRGIEPTRIDVLSPDRRAAEIRKVAPIVATREFYQKTDRDGLQRGRSRKRATLYGGADALFAVTEGNPRWFISVVGSMLDKAGKNLPQGLGSTQATQIENASLRFSALLRTIPVGSASLGATRRGLLSLVDRIGEWAHQQVVGEEFQLDPAATFIVDSAVSGDLYHLVGIGVNIGAFVLIPDGGAQPIVRSLRGKRFRVSYMLAPKYGLPLRLGRAVALSTILERVRPLRSETDQLKLASLDDR